MNIPTRAMAGKGLLLPGLEQYLREHNPPESALLARLRAETVRATGTSAVMQVTAEQGRFMALVASLMGARRYLEIGVFTGYSSLCVATALPHDGRVIACDVSEEWTSIARRYWAEAGVADRIELRLQPALVTLAGLSATGAAGTFDLAFIDADKTSYGAYLDHAWTLLRRGGVVMVDNTLWSGRVADPADSDASTLALRAFNDKLVADPRFEAIMLPIADGLTLARKR